MKAATEILILFLLLILANVPTTLAHAQIQGQTQTEEALAPSGLVNPSADLVKVVGNFKVEVRKDETTGLQRLDVFAADNNKPLMSYTPLSAVEQVRDIDVVELNGYKNPILVTTWYTGAHSQLLVIFDPALKTKALMSSLYSVWTIAFAVNEDHLDIDFYEEATPRTLTTIEWMPGVKIGIDDNAGTVTASGKIKKSKPINSRDATGAN